MVKFKICIASIFLLVTGICGVSVDMLGWAGLTGYYWGSTISDVLNVYFLEFTIVT